MTRLDVVRQSANGLYVPASFEQLQSAQAIAGFAYGSRLDNDTEIPGPVNGDIASCLAEQAFAQNDLPIFTEWEVGKCLESWGILPDVLITPDPTIDNGYVHTRLVVKWLQAWKLEREANGETPLDKVIVCAFANHVPRCIQELARVGITGYAPPGLPTQFDSQSAEIWTLNKPVWTAHETLMQAVMEIELYFPNLITHMKDYVTKLKVSTLRGKRRGNFTDSVTSAYASQ